MQPRAAASLLIVFADITGYQALARRTPDADLAELMNEHYLRAEAAVTGAGGRLVKFMGDAFLAVWTENAAARGLAALRPIASDVRSWCAARGWDGRLVVKAHFGRVVAGGFGMDGRFDVIGREVNVAARLPARTIGLSPAAHALLDETARAAWRQLPDQALFVPADATA